MNEKTKFLLLIFVGKGWTLERVLDHVRVQASKFTGDSGAVISFVAEKASLIYRTPTEFGFGHGFIDIEQVADSTFRIRYGCVGKSFEEVLL